MARYLILSILTLSSLILSTDAVCKDASTLTDDERTIVEQHNKYRQKHENTPDICYGVSGEDVTFTADSMSITDITPSNSGRAFGENRGNIGKQEGYFTNVEASTDVIQGWYDDRSSKPDEGNQVLWKATKQVNCGYGQKRQTMTFSGQTSTWYTTYLICQYFPPGNTKAGAGNIGEVSDNVGDLIPVPCKKPTVADATVTPESDTVNKGETYTVTCKKGFVVKNDESKTSKSFTCSIDGSLTPSEEMMCKVKEVVDDDIPGASPERSVLSISVMVLAVLVELFL